MPLRLPKLVNLWADPFESADVAADMFYGKWRTDLLFALIPRRWSSGALQTLAEFPPSQRPESSGVGTCSKSPAERICAESHSAAKSVSSGLASIGPVVLTVPGIARVSVPGSLQTGGGPARKVRFGSISSIP